MLKLDLRYNYVKLQDRGCRRSVINSRSVIRNYQKLPRQCQTVPNSTKNKEVLKIAKKCLFLSEASEDGLRGREWRDTPNESKCTLQQKPREILVQFSISLLF